MFTSDLIGAGRLFTMAIEEFGSDEEANAKRVIAYRALILVATAVSITLLFGAAVIPYPTLVAPRWGVHVSDSGGKPLAGRLVKESYVDYGTGMQSGSEDRYTDRDGGVEFPAKYVRLSGGKRLLEKCPCTSYPLQRYGPLQRTRSGCPQVEGKFQGLDFPILGMALPTRWSLTSLFASRKGSQCLPADYSVGYVTGAELICHFFAFSRRSSSSFESIVPLHFGVPQ
jgi:hypothetical protein